jgi:two-component system, chemotaxis family, chemotaxis protein CheY
MLRTLIVEDDFVSRKILQALLAPYGLSDIAVNGPEALTAFKMAVGSGQPYHLVCLDIAMPGMDGHQVLAELRTFETDLGIQGLDRARVIMTTASRDPRDVRSAFRSECDAYLLKPIQEAQLLEHLQELHLTGARP